MAGVRKCVVFTRGLWSWLEARKKATGESISSMVRRGVKELLERESARVVVHPAKGRPRKSYARF